MSSIVKVQPTAGAIARPINVDAPFWTRAGQAIRYAIAGVTPETWFSPAQPLQPQADKPGQGTQGRRWDFPVGVNIQYQPRGEQGAGFPFFLLRALADSYDLLRLVIETRKDQIGSYEWEIVPLDEKADSAEEKAQIKRVTEFLSRPTPEHDWPEFLRAILEDHFVCDGVALYPRLNRGGGLHSLYPVDVATIKRYVDEFGMAPTPPSPAYAQVLKGIPAVDYTQEQLVYWIRNQRTSRLYGYGPVEQIIVTVNIALRRQQFALEYYTAGTIPDLIVGVPETWTPDQIREFQDQWDSRLTNTANRRGVQFMPDVKTILNPKEAAVALKDEFDDYLARLICFAFSISPTALQKMVNRASGEQMAEQAKEEGLMPLLNWLSGKMTWIAHNLLQAPLVKFAWKISVEVDPSVQATTNSAYVKAGIITPNEGREAIGKEPLPGGDDLIIETASGPVPLKETVERARQNALNPSPPPPAFGAPGAKPPASGNRTPASGQGEEGGGPEKADDPNVVKRKVRARRDPETGDFVAEITEPVGFEAMRKSAGAKPHVTIHNHVAQPDVLVNVEPTVVHVDQRSGAQPAKITKSSRTKRDTLTGDLLSEITERHEPEAGTAAAQGLVKTVRVERRA